MTYKEFKQVIDCFSWYISENTPLIVTTYNIEEFLNSKYYKTIEGLLEDESI